jgi:hypothetical protein
MKKTLHFLLLLIFFLTPLRTGAQELLERKQISVAVKDAFLAEDFGKLEEMSAKFRRDKSRTSSGVWRLSCFYAGIAQAMPGEKHESDEFYKNLEKKSERWSKTFPGSPPAHIAHSKVLIYHGWFYRGGEYAYKVPKEAWEPFYKYIMAANVNLERNKRIASVDPCWYETMLTVARAQGWYREQFDALLEEALRREPGFYQTYFIALEYLLPKWHGDLAQIEQFANDAVKRTKKEEGLGMYARIYWYASQTQFENDLFSQSLAVWPRMKAGFEDIIARYPDAWNINNYARFSYLARDKQKARELLEKIGGNPIVEAWQPRSLFDQCRRWAFE